MFHSIDSSNAGPHLKLALWCGFLPLITGGLITLAWQFHQHEALMSAGVLTIVVGCFLFVLGSISLWQYRTCARQQEDIPRKKIRSTFSLTGSLLLLNFPAAGACLLWTIGADSHYVVIIQNNSAHTLNDIELVARSETVHLDPIAPGEKDSYDFRAIGESSLVLNATLGEKAIEQMVDSYTMNMGTTTHVTLLLDGSFEIHQSSHPF